MKLDFAGIGVPKAATTWIAECLKEHPQICFSFPKEAYLFRKECPAIEKHFKGCLKDQLKGEFSPTYLVEKNIPKRLKEHNPGMKIIVSLRNPADRAFSHYLHAKALHSNDWFNFRDALKKEPKILELGFYAKYLKNYFNFFEKEQILVLIYEDIKKDPRIFIRNIYNFLGINDDFLPIILDLKVSPTKFKLTRLGRIVHRRLGQPTKKHRFIQKIKKESALRRIYLNFAQKYSQKIKKPKIRKEDRDYLIQVYQKDIQNLENIINRKLDFWKNV